MLIGEVAERTGVTTKALRFYERRGLISEPARTDGGYRDYDPAVVDRVTFIKEAQAAGLTLAQIGQVLAIRDDGDAPCRHVETLIDERLAEVEERLRELRDLRSQLRGLKERAMSLDPADCDEYCRVIAPA